LTNPVSLDSFDKSSLVKVDVNSRIATLLFKFAAISCSLCLVEKHNLEMAANILSLFPGIRLTGMRSAGMRF
jgi:hypothetical protein